MGEGATLAWGVAIMPGSNPALVDDLSFAGEFIRHDHPEYHRSRAVWNGIIDRRPALILRARNASDVNAAVRLAADRGLPLAVRCGGHSFPGYSTCDGGMVLICRL